MASLEELRNERLRKLNLLTERGINPFPEVANPTHQVAEALENWKELLEAGKPVTLAGRVMAIRAHGGSAFFDIADGSWTDTENPAPKIQIHLKKDTAGEESFSLWNNTVDIGDYLETTGTLFLTKRNERTLEAHSWRMLAKSLRPLPDKWEGLSDTEERYRRRYLDTLMSPESKKRFIYRSKIVSSIRTFLDEAGYLEVETPALQPLYGGASAEPFVTHHNALDLDLYLRISDELYLKRLLVGGFPRVYEIARDFRNEGIDGTHSPEFTMLEFYESFSHTSKLLPFIEKMVRKAFLASRGTTTLEFMGSQIDFGMPFTIITYEELLTRYALIPNISQVSAKDLELKARQLGAETDASMSREKLFDLIYKKACRPKLIQPTFIVDYPADMLPLAKRSEKNPTLVRAFQLVAGGIELGKGFSELNDPIDQRSRFETQESFKAEGDSEAQALDEDFIEALEYGMPPTGGFGIGIDRLAMLAGNTDNMKEVIFFPTMRPAQ